MKKNSKAAIHQPSPKISNGKKIFPLVIEDIKARRRAGENTYKTQLRAFNGRDALWDAYQEALDLAVYLRQEIEERGRG